MGFLFLFAKMWREPSRVSPRKSAMYPEKIGLDAKGSASAGAPYDHFLQAHQREPRSRREYRHWLKSHYTTNWQYWYDRYREYLEYHFGSRVGSGHHRARGW